MVISFIDKYSKILLIIKINKNKKIFKIIEKNILKLVTLSFY